MSSSMRSSSSELDDMSDTAWLVLPTELDICMRSWLPIMDQSDVDVCSAPPYSALRRPGMFMAREPAVGEESGEVWSARVEWCRLVAAREKSRPRDLRGRMFVGEA